MSTRHSLPSNPVLPAAPAPTCAAVAGPEVGALPTEWWSHLGHDLRSSIAPMRMAVQLLQSGRIAAADQADALQVIDRQLDSLLTSIDDLSDLLRLNAGKRVVNPAPNDLNLLLDIVSGRGSLLKRLEARHQSLSCVPVDAPVITNHDPARLVALLEYLIGKSAECAAPGAVLTLELCRQGGQAQMRITGAGPLLAIDPDVRNVTGAAPISADTAGIKSLLMREYARLSAISFSPIDEKIGIAMAMSLVPD
ncbi:MAG: histidine kinase dimerization/phospho-acceptor domain-containing protein [Arenimonas sp.]